MPITNEQKSLLKREQLEREKVRRFTPDGKPIFSYFLDGDPFVLPDGLKKEVGNPIGVVRLSLNPRGKHKS